MKSEKRSSKTIAQQSFLTLRYFVTIKASDQDLLSGTDAENKTKSIIGLQRLHVFCESVNTVCDQDTILY